MWSRPILLGALAAIFPFLATVYSKVPSHDRDWQTHLSIAPKVDMSRRGAAIAPVRDWTYDEGGAVSEGWLSSTEIDLGQLKQVWFVVEPHPGLQVMAHTLVLFEFRNGDLLGLTIEARKQKLEKFAPLAGAFRRFELVYVWAEPRDLLTRRAVYLDHELYIYPLDLTPDGERAYLNALLERSVRLHDQPRFYNTLFSNCTNELAKTAGLGWQPAFVLTGRSDEALFDKGLIAGASFEDARNDANMTDIVKALNGKSSDLFNQELLAALSGDTP